MSGKPGAWAGGPTRGIVIRFPVAMIAEIDRRATSEDRPISSWVRRACEAELRRLEESERDQ